MPIPRISEERLQVQFQLRKGAPKTSNAPGRDLDHFRFDPTDPEDTELVDSFKHLYGTKPREVTIHFPKPDIDSVFSYWMEEYVAGGLIHRCDGDFKVERDGTGRLVRTDERCPFADMELMDPKRACKPVGRLQFTIEDLCFKVGRAVFGLFATGSINDIENLAGAFRVFDGLFEQRESGLLGIPFRLYRYQNEISTPGKDGKRLRRKAWLVNIELAPKELRLGLNRHALEQIELPPAEDQEIEPPFAMDPDTGEVIEPEPSPPEPEPEEESLEGTISEVKRLSTFEEITDKERAGIERRIAEGMNMESAKAGLAWLVSTIAQRQNEKQDDEGLPF